jgi:class 3 adenylate cyclase
MAELPTGTVTFLFTDIEGSTALAQQYPADLPILLAQHHAILHQAIEAHHGHVFQITGDAFCAAFHTASDALQAALAAQRRLQQEAWHPAPIKVRMGVHTGAAEAGQIGSIERLMCSVIGDAVNVASRLETLTKDYPDYPILINGPTVEALQTRADLELQSLGPIHVKGRAEAVDVYAVIGWRGSTAVSETGEVT